MIILICIIALVDALILPVKGYLSGNIFVLIGVIGLFKKSDYKKWFSSALVFITLATASYLLDRQTFTETTVHKLSDWSFLFLVVGIIQLARHSRKRP